MPHRADDLFCAEPCAPNAALCIVFPFRTPSIALSPPPLPLGYPHEFAADRALHCTALCSTLPRRDRHGRTVLGRRIVLTNSSPAPCGPLRTLLVHSLHVPAHCEQTVNTGTTYAKRHLSPKTRRRRRTTKTRSRACRKYSPVDPLPVLCRCGQRGFRRDCV